MTICYRPFLAALAVLGLACLPARSVAAQEEEAGLTCHAHFMSGKLYLSPAQRVYDKAERELRLAVECDTTVAEYRAFWATALCELAKEKLNATAAIADPAGRLKAIQDVATLYQTAAGQFQTAIALDPKKQMEFSGQARLHFWVDLYKQAGVQFDEKRYEVALEMYKLLTYLDPREPEGHFRVAFTLDRMGQTKVAVILAGQARDLAEQRISELGDCSQFISRKMQGECRKQITTYEKIKANVDGFTRSKNVALGAEALQNADSEPNAETKRLYLDEAVQFFKRGLEQDPGLLGTRFDLANAYFMMAHTWDTPGGRDTSQANPNYHQAARIFLELVRSDSTDAETRDAARYNAGQALYAAGSWVQALPVLRSYIALRPREPETYPLVAKCMAELRRPADASAYMRMLTALTKGDSVVVTESVNTAKNLYSGSDMDKALAELGNPGSARSYLEPETSETVVTWIWWEKTEARHFIKGLQVGVVRFPPEK